METEPVNFTGFFIAQYLADVRKLSFFNFLCFLQFTKYQKV